MPFAIRKQGNKFVVVKKEDGKVMGTHDSEEKAKKQLAALNINVKNSISFMTIVESVKIKEKDNSKWAEIDGTALTNGMSKNNVDYTIKNLQENDGKSFNVLVGHREDYDNPDHNVGEGLYNLESNNLKYSMKVMNTPQHPDIVEKIKDELVAPSVQGGFDSHKVIKENGKSKVTVEGLHIPILSLVNKHVRGVDGADIATVIAERIEMEKNNIQEVNNMEDKDVFAKQIEEKDNLLTESKKTLEESEGKINEANDKLKESEEKIKKFEEAEKARVLKEKEELVDKLCESNKELKKEELMEKSDDELKIIEGYEIKIKEQKNPEGSGIVSMVGESAKEAKEDNDNIMDITVMERTGDLTMTEEANEKFNQEIKERILGHE